MKDTKQSPFFIVTRLEVIQMVPVYFIINTHTHSCLEVKQSALVCFIILVRPTGLESWVILVTVCICVKVSLTF